MASKWGTSLAQSKILKTSILTGIFNVLFAIDDASFEAMFPYVPHVSVGPNLVRSCRQKVPSCSMLELELTWDGYGWLQFGIHLDRFGPNFSPT
jgi:hypothetical protein